jgi:hypothetical protein
MIDAVSCWCTGPVPWLMDKHLRRGAREGRKRTYHVRLGANRKLRTRHKSYSFDAQLGDKEDVQISLLVGITRQSVFFFLPSYHSLGSRAICLVFELKTHFPMARSSAELAGERNGLGRGARTPSCLLGPDRSRLKPW